VRRTVTEDALPPLVHFWRSGLFFFLIYEILHDEVRPAKAVSECYEPSGERAQRPIHFLYPKVRGRDHSAYGPVAKECNQCETSEAKIL
jgi:hypothetical protein